jgi:DtxR family Mn-dependent transcriptional regulator
LDKQKIALGSTFLVKEKESFDDTLLVEINSKEITISNKIATNLYVH